MLNNVQPLTITQPAQWLCLDIETGDAPDAAIAAAIANWKAPSNWKPETVEAKHTEAAEKIRDKAALLDASPLLCVVIKTDRDNVVFNGMSETGNVPDWETVSCGSEKNMLLKLRSWLDRMTTPETLIVGHNLRNFDLPKLRNAFVRHRLQLPEILKPRLRLEEKAETVDTAALFKTYSMENRDNLFISLDTVAIGLGIERPKQVISGDEVPKLHRNGQFEPILIYCAIDVATTARAWQLMSGNAPDLV
jgi:hypothetical protein